MRGLKYVSWGDTTGYAVAAKAYVRALIAANVPLTWSPMLTGRNLYEPYLSRQWSCAKLASVCNRVIDYDTVLIHTVPEYYPAVIREAREAGHRVLGYTVWELERLPSHWPAILNQLDGVIVPCRWNAQVFRDSGVSVPIHVVPHLSQFEEIESTLTSTADQRRWQERLQAAGAKSDAFVFYAVGFWSNRKALALVLEAFLDAFDASDPVALVLKTSRNDITRWHRHWRHGFRLRHPSPSVTVAQRLKAHSCPAPCVVVTDEGLTDAEMLALHRHGDCFVSLARTEGWGMGLFEAARLGKPVIACAYGGQTDYLGLDETCIVPHEMVPVNEPTWALSYRETDQWAEPSVAHASRSMRAVFESPQAFRVRAVRQSERIRREFSADAITRRLLKALDQR